MLCSVVTLCVFCLVYMHLLWAMYAPFIHLVFKVNFCWGCQMRLEFYLFLLVAMLSVLQHAPSHFDATKWQANV